MNRAPTRSLAETGHDRRAVRTCEPAWLTSVLPFSDSSEIPNLMLPVAPSRGCTDAPILASPNFRQGVTASYSR
jgi:hypothetical protein